ncbi:signal peptide peptidase SppA [Cyanobacterium aponinum]|uniref:signal peptide peptidase SppA n=1 Tax=Cyanobacterium aponinum TaxID=379064 RepID=UPI000C12B960|nr:signal peptide peptidase SppA [Cyanobacterium aponinum]PHV63411.1 signal peptide peptidase SppA [Cyanobacterium aponinum IPPAS B-1201]
MKKFLQQTLASFLGSLASLSLLALLSSGGLFILIVVLLSMSSTPKIENQSALVFNLNSQISDYQRESDLNSLLGGNNTENLTLRDITYAINKAAEDKRISVLYLDGSRGNLITGYASLTEINNALEKFKASGKKIIAYNVSAGEQDYFITSIADEIILNPMGGMEMNGLASSQLFFASALQKYGIGVQVVRVGKYKSAVEPFILDNYSPESKLQTQDLIDDLWNSYIENVTNNRDLKAGEINNIADNKGILQASEAKNLKIIDQIKYEDEIISQLKTITNSENEDNFRKISIKDYITANPEETSSSNQIAILYVEGTIVDGEGRIGEVGGNRYVAEIRKIRQNDDIKGVIVRINSPGGSAIASELILRELQLTAKEKPVVVSMGDVAASGGYWISTAGEKVFASNNTITGSIGVFGLIFNVEDIAQNNGINNEVVKTNKFADLGNGFAPKTDAELSVIQQGVDQVYDLFLERVSQARNLPIEKVAEIAQGRVWSGQAAQKIGLIDEIGGLDKSLEYLNEKLELNNNYQLISYPEKRSWQVELINQLSGAKLNSNLTDKETLLKMIWEENTELQLREILRNPHQIYSILPYKLNIK